MGELINLGLVFWAALATVIAGIAAWVSKQSWDIARRAADDARKGAHATILSGLIDEYKAPEMHDAMAMLREYTARSGLVTEKFSQDLQREFGSVSPSNAARRRVSTYFDKVWAVHKILGDEHLDLCMTKGQVEFYREVIEPLEAALNIKYNREPFEWFGERYGVGRSPLIALMEGWEKAEGHATDDEGPND